MRNVPPPARWLIGLERTLSAVLLFCVGAYVLASWNWPLVGDAPLIHYVVFLMEHGLAPYRDVLDLNQPGTLAMEWAVMTVLGRGALAWRIFDLLLLCGAGVAMVFVCRAAAGRRRSAFAALWSAATFALIHGRDGLIELGQRDLLLAVLLAACFALVLSAVRSRGSQGYGVSTLAGLCLGCACTVKPHVVLLAPALLAWTGYQSRKQGSQWQRRLGALAAGVAVPLLGSALFLLREHALAAFVRLMLQLGPYHASMWRRPFGALLAGSVSSVLLPVFCLWLPVFVAGRRWRLVADQALLLGFLFGVFSFCVQGRGYPYHRYPSELFLLLLASTGFTETLAEVGSRRPWGGWKQWLPKGCAVAGLVFGALVVVPRSLVEIVRYEGRRDDFGQGLTADLSSLGGKGPGQLDKLDKKVQCLDMAGGCVATLYRMGLVESSGFLYDCYLYPAEGTGSAGDEERDRYRDAFRAAWVRSPPELLIVSSDACGATAAPYSKLDRWPWLAGYLGAHYRLAAEHTPDSLQRWGGRPALPYGYRIYRFARP